jgi:hypothetical protein
VLITAVSTVILLIRFQGIVQGTLISSTDPTASEVRAAQHGAHDLVSYWTHMEQTIYNTDGWRLRPGGRRRQDEEVVWDLRCEWTLEMELLRTMLVVNSVMMTGRLTEIWTIFRGAFVGRIVAVIFQVYQRDLKVMLGLLLLPLSGFGFAFSLASPNFMLENADGPLYLGPFNMETLDVSAGSAFWQPVWALFGFFDVGEFSSSPSATFMSPVILFLFLFFVVLPFINLFIALLLERVVDDTTAQEFWRMQQVKRLENYLDVYPAPAPLNLIVLPLDLLSRLWRRVCRRRRPIKVTQVQPGAGTDEPKENQPSPRGTQTKASSEEDDELVDFSFHEETGRQRFLEARKKAELKQAQQPNMHEALQHFNALEERVVNSVTAVLTQMLAASNNSGATLAAGVPNPPMPPPGKAGSTAPHHRPIHRAAPPGITIHRAAPPLEPL